MQPYVYKAMNPLGTIVRGKLDAIGIDDLEARLRRIGLDLIDGRPRRFAARGVRRMPRRELILLCFHLQQLLAAGIPLVTALTDLRDSVDSPRLRETLAALVESIAGGATLSQAFAGQAGRFDPVTIGLIACGEASGLITDILGKLVDTLKWQDELYAQARQFLTYPALLFAILAAVTGFLLTYLVPQLAGFLRSIGEEIPLQTRLLLRAADITSAGGPWLLAALPVLLTSTLLLARSARIRPHLDRIALALPVCGPLLTKLILARFASTFALLYAAGISILDALRICESVIGNHAIGSALQQAQQRIAEGEGVAAAFEATALFPPLVIRMLRVGESTGRLDTALNNVGYFYQRDVRNALDRLLLLAEPALTLFLGLLLGWLVLAVLGPVYTAAARMAV
jgi:type IV pilus assembly protein PilC